jgi:hypothetical protein
MSRRPRGRIGRSTRRQALPTFGFLRPLAQREEEEDRFRQRLRENPSLRREYRSGLILQLVVVGGLLLGCTVLLVQSFTLIDAFQRISSLSPFVWFLPLLVVGLGALALRRFLRVLAEFRKLP